MIALRLGLRWGVPVALTVLALLVGMNVHANLERAQAALVLDMATLHQPGQAPALRSLPDAWPAPVGNAAPRRYELSFTVPPEWRDDQLYLYVPFYDPHIRLALNGSTIFESEAQNGWPGPTALSTTLQLLPMSRMRQGANTLELTVFREGSDRLDVRGRLSGMRLGTKDQLLGLYYLRRSFDHALKPILLGGQALLAIYGMFSFVLRPQDPVYGWLGLMMTVTTLLGVGALADAIPEYRSVMQALFLLAPAGGLSLLGFSLSLTGRPVNRPVLIAAAVVPGLGIVMQYGLGVAPDQTFALLSGPVLFASFLVSATVLLHQMWREPRLELGLFLAGNLALILGAIHDVAAFYGRIDNGLMLGQATRLLSLAGMTVLIFRRQADTANALDRASAEQRRRLEEQEAELAVYHAREREKAEQAAVEEERARITRDLHDGVASHLLTISALAERPADTTPQIRDTARSALVDLRLVIDALTIEDGDLRFFLGVFRERCIDPLAMSGVDVDWSMTGLPMDISVSRETALDIFRTLQEALSNALRHGDGQWLRARGYRLPDGQLRIVLQNRGGSNARPDGPGGLGLSSMTRRAERLGGVIGLSQDEGLYAFELTFPAP